jgi:hypothetical protein
MSRGATRTVRRGGIAALVVILGAGGFVVTRSGGGTPHGAKASSAALVPASSAPLPAAAPSAPADVVSRAVVAMPASSHAAGAAAPWHASLQPAVVAATRVESLAAYQVQVENWTCEGERCVGNLRIPPTVSASRDMSSAANVFNSLKKQMADEDVGVAVRSMQPGPQGLAMSFEFTPSASQQGRFYTFAEIADIRGDSFQQGHKAAEQELAGHGRDPAH